MPALGRDPGSQPRPKSTSGSSESCTDQCSTDQGAEHPCTDQCHRRYTSIRVYDSEEDQVGRIRYCLAQGCRENLVLSPRHWPGARGLPAILNGRYELEGIWVNRTDFGEAERRAKRPRRRGRKKVRQRDFLEVERVRLTPFPCWSHLGKSKYRRLAAAAEVPHI